MRAAVWTAVVHGLIAAVSMATGCSLDVRDLDGLDVAGDAGVPDGLTSADDAGLVTEASDGGDWEVEIRSLTQCAGALSTRGEPVNVHSRRIGPVESVVDQAMGTWFSAGPVMLSEDGRVLDWRGTPALDWGGTPLPFGEAELESLAESSSDSGFCALARDGNAYCWNRAYPAPSVRAGPFSKLAMGAANYACGIRSEDRTLDCWQTFPVEGSSSTITLTGWWADDLPLGQRVLDLTMSAYGGCVLDMDGYPECWGYLQPRLNVFPPSGPMGRVAAPAKRLESIVMCSMTVCGLDEEDRVECWSPYITPETNPRPPHAFVEISVGGLLYERDRPVVCGRTAEGDVLCGTYGRRGPYCDALSGAYAEDGCPR